MLPPLELPNRYWGPSSPRVAKAKAKVAARPLRSGAVGALPAVRSARAWCPETKAQGRHTFSGGFRSAREDGHASEGPSTADVREDDRISRRATLRAQVLYLERTRAQEESLLTKDSVKKIEEHLRHMNQNRCELADINDQLRTLLRPQALEEKAREGPRHESSTQRSRATVAARIMAPVLSKFRHRSNSTEATDEELAMQDLSDRLGLSVPAVKKLKWWFDVVDREKSGLIDQKEFSTLMREIHPGTDLSQKHLDEWWRRVDFDRSGVASFEEMIAESATWMAGASL